MSSHRAAAFLSYASRYRDWVTMLQGNLERCLEHAGRPGKVLLDTLDLGAGYPWLDQLQAGIDGSERLILVVTPETFASPWQNVEYQALMSQRRDWRQGLLLPVLLVDTPLPPFLKTLQFVDLKEHDEEKYRKGLAEIVALLLGFSDKRDLPSLPDDLQIPQPPAIGLPATLRKRLVSWLAPILGKPMARVAISTRLRLPENALEQHPSRECAASTALVLATGDDQPKTAALRVIDVLLELLAEDQPAERIAELRGLRQEINRHGRAASGGLLDAWLQRVIRDHGVLVSYFQQRAGFDLLDPVYVQLELRPETARIMLQEEHRLPCEPLEIRRVLSLDPAEHAWVTRRWVVLGDPGAGKTTMLRHLAAGLAREEQAGLVPVFESLPRLLRDREPLLDRLERQMLRAGNEVRGLAGVLDRSGREGRLLLLLDGLDEVRSEDRNDAEVLLRELAARWPLTPLVVTSRPIGYQRPANDFVELELLPLDGDRRRQFLARWFGRFTGTPDAERAEREATLLEADPGLRELAANPLYLTLMALLIEQDNPPRRHRTGLYDQVFDLLLNGRHRPDGTPIDCIEAVRGVLRHLAYAMTTDNRDAEPMERIETRLYQPELDKLRAQLERVPRWRQSLRPFLAELGERTGILGPHDGEENDWRFWHRTFREALAAEALEQVLQERGEAAVLEHVRGIAGDESRWAEPYALLAGRIGRPDDLVRALVRENQALGLRSLASAQGLQDDTVCELLELTDDWEERAKVYERIPELLGEPEPAIALLDLLRRRTRNGNDLFFLDLAARQVGERWPEHQPLAEQLRTRLYDHIPAPPEELLQWIETPQDGRVPLWQEIPAGSFHMGSPDGEGDADEHPRHRVTITSPFRCSVVPVTNALYLAFDPDHEPRQWEGVPPEELLLHPVVSVTWYQAVSFCHWLASVALQGARLPTEEEWEYACRAGTKTRYWSGDDESDLADVGWYSKNSDERTHRVGEKRASPWGLYDMHGNVREWTSSPWRSEYGERVAGFAVDPLQESTKDVTGSSGGRRVIRGGGYWFSADGARAAYRFDWDPEVEVVVQGFRVVVPVSPEHRQ